MHFGEPLDDERFATLLRPGGGIDTIITADVYGKGAADLAVGRALAGVPREDYCLVGAIGHDFYEGERQGAKGFPRLTDPALRGPEAYGDYIRMATEKSLERCGVDRFDVLLLHNPDRIGFTSEAVWAGMAALLAVPIIPSAITPAIWARARIRNRRRRNWSRDAPARTAARPSRSSVASTASSSGARAIPNAVTSNPCSVPRTRV